MSQKQNKTIFDDVAKVTGDFLSSLGNLKNEIESFINDKVNNYFEKMNFVRREEFEVLKEMVVQLRKEQEESLTQYKSTHQTNPSFDQE